MDSTTNILHVTVIVEPTRGEQSTMTVISGIKERAQVISMEEQKKNGSDPAIVLPVSLRAGLVF